MKISTALLACLLTASTAFSYTLERRSDAPIQPNNFNQENQQDIEKKLDEFNGELDKIKDEMPDNLPIPNLDSMGKPSTGPELGSGNINSSNNGMPNNTDLGSGNIDKSTNGAPNNEILPDSGNIFGNTNNSMFSGQGTDAFTPECIKVITEYASCLPEDVQKMTSQNYDEICNTYNSEKCVNLFKKKLSENEACKTGTAEFEAQLIMSAGLMDLSCAKDGNKYCPISELSKQDKDITQEALDQTCKSKVCLEKAISGIEATKQLLGVASNVQNALTDAFSNMQKRQASNADEALKMFDGYLTQLKAEKCQAQATSGAIPLKIGNLFILTLGLFLYFL